MGIINFKYTKIASEINEFKKGEKISLNHDIQIKDVRELDVKKEKPAQDFVEIHVGYTIIYSKLGKIELAGKILYLDSKEIVEEIRKMWKKEKKIPTTITQTIYKFAYAKMVPKAYGLADELSLPSPLPLPKINFNNEKK